VTLVDGAPTSTPEWAAAYVEEHRADVEALRAATRCDGCDWELRLEDGARAKIPEVFRARNLALLLVLDGHAHAAAGDPRAAPAGAGRARGPAGPFLPVRIGASGGRPAARALARLVTSTALSAGDLAEVEREVAVLEGLAPGRAEPLRRERLLTLATWADIA